MEWTPETLNSTLAQLRDRRGDSTTIEVKRSTGGVPSMAETLCAFANMPNGGTVILGVDEGDAEFTIVGVQDIAQLEAGLVSSARHRVRPEPHIEFKTIEVGKKRVLIATVSPLPLADKPARVGDRAYLRQADGDYPMHAHEERMIEVARLHSDEQVNYDLEPAKGRDRNDLNKNLTEWYVSEVRSRDRRLANESDEQILRLTNVLTASGEPTLAGLYALGDYPQGQYPALTVTAAVQLAGGEGQARNRNLQDFTGPLPVLLDELLQWVEHNLHTDHVYRDDGHLETVPELPLNAVRELLANALVHRDLGPNTLGTGKQIQIRMTDKSLFVQSPGGLRGVSLAQLESIEHAQAAVNQRLYHIAKRLTTRDGASIIEGEGGGIREVFRSTKQRGLRDPQLVDTGVQFKALLWRPVNALHSQTRNNQQHSLDHSRGRETVASSSSPTKNEATVLGALAMGPLDIHALAEASNLTIGQVRYALRRPLQENIVAMEGRQGIKSTRYSLT
ncbi:divergent AAA domain protein [Brevibacterium mcbrellneri ATCC 49030]|uniref:Divergent AAA domain protein n=1 Tax=Brevibacterium mcbrellneri ATCC 49030 TaxID=585530 RepID=D4YLE9_9MICO|nr:RNA-binding domain-containing protein [Brevibacterium mcbrellneri]EFG47983.1 divergent AAA domain protein [Brevibacterium mcbrellneri ATCC 49030]